MTNYEKFKEVFGCYPESALCPACSQQSYWSYDYKPPVDYKEQLLKASAQILKDYCSERDCSGCIFEDGDGCKLITIPQYFKLEEVNDG